MSKRELRKAGLWQISLIVQARDLAELFGEELFDLGYEPGGEWVHEFLEKLQATEVEKIRKRCR